MRHHGSAAPGRSFVIADPPTTSSSAAAELQQLLLDTAGIAEFLQELANLAVTQLPGDLSCGITSRRGDRSTTVASTDERASQVDEIQYAHHQGPCLTSIDSGEVVHIDDLADDDRWGPYRAPALAHGVRSSLSVPLRVDADVVGAMNIYAGEPHTFGPRERTAAEQFAAEASRALALAVRMAERTEMSDHLQSALASRAVIDQALGIVMAQNRCTADEAFETLRAISQNRNVKLRDVAGQIVDAVGRRRP